MINRENKVLVAASRYLLFMIGALVHMGFSIKDVRFLTSVNITESITLWIIISNGFR